MLQLVLQTPAKALNPAYRKASVSRLNMDAFKMGLKNLFEQSHQSQSEETLKNLLHGLLCKHQYEPEYHLSVNKQRQDMSIHLGKKYEDAVGVIIETKAIGSPEMISAQKPNTRALHELALYYLRERISNNNNELKYLVATDIHDWILFDANEFDKKIMANTAIRRLFEVHQNDGKRNDFFYGELKSFFDRAEITLQATGFHLPQYKKAALNTITEDDKTLLPLYKILSPAHLLKLPVANDSNSLDKGFYTELLHLIGLEEVKDKGKKLISRRQPANRHEASLLENALLKLQDKEALRNLSQAQRQGDTSEEQYFNLALELSITWVNRILFMKLLEAQLLSYHNNDRHYRFLTKQLVHDFDELNNLFFQVLAEQPDKRRVFLQNKFAAVPYLNSSLFERTEIERRTIDISALDNQLHLPILTGTVLKDDKGRRRGGGLTTLEYLFEFLDAYKFSSDGGNEIQEDNKTLINASVLGLIFEKINGYKDGSFFTPGFITMYMCRQTIRQAVLQKFNSVKGWQCNSMDDLYDKIPTDNRNEANAIINSLHICDPAVGSGHFLVSALNELIAVKHDLRILQDRQGRRLKEYQLTVANDELVITDDDGEPFSYKPGNAEKQRVQETLFHEKQTLIENCLFGVDINPNSVKICRLRLWIELLKNAYYKISSPGPSPFGGGREGAALETLPNIDINIKCGNSLVSRFAINADLKQALKKSKFTIDSYRLAVTNYRHAKTKDEKRELEDLIQSIKTDFTSEIETPFKKKISEARGKADMLAARILNLKSFGEKIDKPLLAEHEKAVAALAKLDAEKTEITDNKIFGNAFEWHFEFPEVLTDDGDFEGFDVVMGNPPYIRQEEISWMKPYLQKQFSTYAGTADLYVFFVEKGMQLLKGSGLFCYILPNKWMKGGYGKALRQWALQKQTLQMVDFGDLPVFEEATTYASIWLMQNKPAETAGFTAAVAATLDYPEGMEQYLQTQWLQVSAESLTPESWNLVDSRKQQLLDKIKAAGKPLGEYVNGKIYRGVLTGLNEAFVIDNATRQRLIAEDPQCADIIKPFLAGKDIKRYQQPVSDKWLIFIPWHFPLHNDQAIQGASSVAEAAFLDRYPSIYKHLSSFRTELENRNKAETGVRYEWYALQRCAATYFSEFDEPKIVIPAIVKSASYGFDITGAYSNDKTSIIPTTDYLLLGILNSKVVDYYLKQIASTKQNGYYEYKPVYVSQLPIAALNDSQKTAVEIRVQQILALKKENNAADTSWLEKEIDALLYAAYELNEEEVGMVEGR